MKRARPKETAAAAQLAGQGKGLGVKGGYAQACQGKDQDEDGVVRRKAEERTEKSRQEGAGDDEVAPGHAVRPQAHEGLAQVA